MKILILTQYYPPETGAAQNRLHALARDLKDYGIAVDVLTAMPNYPQMKVFKGYRKRCFKRETIDGISVSRSWIYVKGSKSMIHRLMNYFSFVFSAFCAGLLRTGKYDYILVESPPLFLGITAYGLSRLKGAKMIFNVSDLWPESAEKLGLVRSKFLLKMSARLEEFMYRKSYFITGQTRGIVNNISSRFPAKPVYWLPNGAELDFYDPDRYDTSQWRNEMGYDPDDFLIFYGGILGHAQGLEVILRAAKRLKQHKKIQFIIMGSGPRHDELIKIKADLELQNVQFIDAVPRKVIPRVLASIDVSVIPLKKLELFKGAIPSKIFESLAMEKPILLGVEGEARELFVEEGKGGMAFIPEDDIDLAEKVLLLHADSAMRSIMGEAGRNYVKQKFDRKKIAGDLFNILKEQKTKPQNKD